MRRWVKGAGVFHQDFLDIDFLVVSDRGECTIACTVFNWLP